jgi:hypothetical protein
MTEFTPTPEEAAREHTFLECVRKHPGITAEEIAEEIQVPVQIVRQACAHCLGAGTLEFSDGRYFAIPDSFFVAAPKPQLPDLPQPTEAGLDSWELFYGLLKKAHRMTREQFAELPKESQAAIQDSVEAAEITLWRDSRDSEGYVRTQENFIALGTWLNQRHAPITQRNLTRAFRALNKMKQDPDDDKWLN